MGCHVCWWVGIFLQEGRKKLIIFSIDKSAADCTARGFHDGHAVLRNWSNTFPVHRKQGKENLFSFWTVRFLGKTSYYSTQLWQSVSTDLPDQTKMFAGFKNWASHRHKSQMQSRPCYEDFEKAWKQFISWTWSANCFSVQGRKTVPALFHCWDKAWGSWETQSCWISHHLSQQGMGASNRPTAGSVLHRKNSASEEVGRTISLKQQEK